MTRSCENPSVAGQSTFLTAVVLSPSTTSLQSIWNRRSQGGESLSISRSHTGLSLTLLPSMLTWIVVSVRQRVTRCPAPLSYNQIAERRYNLTCSRRCMELWSIQQAKEAALSFRRLKWRKKTSHRMIVRYSIWLSPRSVLIPKHSASWWPSSETRSRVSTRRTGWDRMEWRAWGAFIAHPSEDWAPLATIQISTQPSSSNPLASCLRTAKILT